VHINIRHSSTILLQLEGENRNLDLNIGLHTVAVHPGLSLRLSI